MNARTDVLIPEDLHVSEGVGGGVGGYKALAGTEEGFNGPLGGRTPARTIVIGDEDLVGLEGGRVEGRGLFRNANIEAARGFENPREEWRCRAPVVVVAAGEDEDAHLAGGEEMGWSGGEGGNSEEAKNTHGAPVAQGGLRDGRGCGRPDPVCRIRRRARRCSRPH